MLGNPELGGIVFSKEELDRAELMRHEYLSRRATLKPEAELTEVFVGEEVSEDKIFIDAFQASRSRALAIQSAGFHMGRYRKFADKYDSLVRVSGGAITETGIKNTLEGYEQNMTTEAALVTDAKRFAADVEAELGHLGEQAVVDGFVAGTNQIISSLREKSTF